MILDPLFKLIGDVIAQPQAIGPRRLRRAGGIDLHTHILPKTWPDLDARYGGAGWPWWSRCSARWPVCWP